MVSLLRRRMMVTENIAYEAYNLSFDGSNYIDTGVYLFSANNINRDFELIATDVYCQSGTNTQTIIGSKLDGPSYGFLVRGYDASNNIYAGTLYIKPNINRSFKIKRINGVISKEGDINNNPSFINTAFDQPVVLGCALQSDGTPYRYTKGTIAHIVIRWL